MVAQRSPGIFNFQPYSRHFFCPFLVMEPPSIVRPVSKCMRQS